MAKGLSPRQPKLSSRIGSRGRSRSSSMDSSESARSSGPKSMREPVKVSILGAGGGIGQPLAMLLMLRCEYVQHVAMHDLVDSIHGIGLDLSHVDRRCKITTHLGQDELAEAVRGSKVVIIPAGLAQKPGMSRDDLFGSNAKILFDLAKVCAQVAPKAMLAIITNPVNSLVPIACEVYHAYAGSGKDQRPSAQADVKSVASQQNPTAAGSQQKQQADGARQPSAQTGAQMQPPPQQQQKSVRSEAGNRLKFEDCFRRIFGVTTLDVVRASTLTAKSTLFKSEPHGLFRDPQGLQIPVVGGHAGKTIMPLLSQARPKLDRKRLLEEKASTMTLVESIQQAGIDVLNAKRGKGSATLAMAYSAYRFTISLLKAISGEPNIVECAYVHQPSPVFGDLDYFATPLILGKEGFVKSLGIPGCCATNTSNPDSLLPFEQQMLEEGSRELKSSIAKGEDFAREQLMSDR